MSPDPAGGWSARVRQVDHALILPSPVPDMVQPAGVFDAAGEYVHEAVLWRGRPLMYEPDRVAPQDHVPGTWIWGGVLLNHFGHFLTESTGRLWASRPGVDGILFISKRSEPDETGEIGLQPFHQLFFQLMGIDLPIKVIVRPSTVERLEVPGQGFGIGSIAAGTDAFRAFVGERFGKAVAPEGPERLYISRSELGAMRGGVLEETRIEAYLAEHGYETFHPQRHSLTDQIARYKAAKQIVALDGSALHLVAMLGQRDQKVALIRRRNSSAANTIISHLSSFMGRDPDVIDVIKRDWVRSDRARADRFSIGELDFAALSARLGELGYVPDGAALAALSEDEARAAIGLVEEKLKREKLRFEPLAPGARRVSTEPPEGGAGQAEAEPNPRRAARLARRARQARRAARRAVAVPAPELG